MVVPIYCSKKNDQKVDLGHKLQHTQLARLRVSPLAI